ncbi:UNVERIFIED_CONTAM: hypothetical protein Slati_2361000 [Sesamum latifolium]|uniref:Uncharacterized protein n=1 Tax=Sesamum latifolium TaxID=2727402 RepID=A0AAW2WF36_9LAMI
MPIRIRGSVILRQVGFLPVEGEFVCHDFFTEGDTLYFIIRGSSYLMLNILKAFLKAVEAGKPLLMNLLRTRWGSPLPPVRWGYRDRDVSFRFLFKGVYVGRGGYSSTGQHSHLFSNCY